MNTGMTELASYSPAQTPAYATTMSVGTDRRKNSDDRYDNSVGSSPWLAYVPRSRGDFSLVGISFDGTRAVRVPQS